ncbi:MAG: histidine phosphatase family protein [Betaproteobacteria bacterium]
MKPKRIILIRHGESEGNTDKNIYARKPDYALCLTEKGKQQARKAGQDILEFIGSESIGYYISPHFRTRETFQELIKAFPVPPLLQREEPRIREQEWGHFRSLAEGASVDRERDSYGTFHYRIPDGESAADVYDRVSDFFGTLFRGFLKEDFPQNIVIVTHGMTARLFLMRWFHWTVEKFESLPNPKNCGTYILERTDTGKYALLTDPGERSVVHPWRMEP